MSENPLFSLDRFEGDVAVLVCDDGSCVDVSIALLPTGACEGKLYRKIGEHYLEDIDAFKARQQRVRALQNRLRGR